VQFVQAPNACPRVAKTGPELNDPAGSRPAWTLQQLREAIPSDHTYRFIVHDRDAIFSTGLDASLAHLGPRSHRNTRAHPQGEFALRKTNRDTPA
jgi:hypothetical protein